MGDPQAPFEKVLAILDRHELLDANGLLRGDVQLVSMGDHFDWGLREERATAGRDALLLLGWFCAHTPEQVITLVGNHDLARLGELAGFDDRTFQSAQAEAEGRLGVSQSIRGRVADLGGTVTWDSTPGQGTEVEITLGRTSSTAVGDR